MNGRDLKFERAIRSCHEAKEQLLRLEGEHQSLCAFLR